jgi:hypothetical protein
VAFGLTTAVLAALVTSATLWPQPSPPRRVPTLVLPAVQAEPATRSASTLTINPREPTTAPTLSTPTSDTVPLAVSRPTTTPGPARTQAPATAGTTRITEALDRWRYHHPAPVTTPTTPTAPTTTTAPTTSLATPASTEPTTGPAILNPLR